MKIMAPLLVVDNNTIMPHQSFVRSPNQAQERYGGGCYDPSFTSSSSSCCDTADHHPSSCHYPCSSPPLLDCGDNDVVQKQHQMIHMTTGDSEAFAPTVGNQKKRVSFSNSIQFQEIPHVSELTNDELIATWWTPNDYQVIRKMVSLTVRLITSSTTSSTSSTSAMTASSSSSSSTTTQPTMGSSTMKKFHVDDQDFCERGLEMRTNTVKARSRHYQKQRAMLTVLEAQEFQRQEGFADHDYIGELYQEFTEDSSKDALIVGLADEQTAKALCSLSLTTCWGTTTSTSTSQASSQSFSR